MRSYVPQYELRAPATLVEALDLMSEEAAGWRPFAGGTDVMVVLEAGRLEHTRFISLARVKDLRFIDVREREVEIGASTTYTEVRRHQLLEAEFPMLGMAAAETGARARLRRQLGTPGRVEAEKS